MRNWFARRWKAVTWISGILLLFIAGAGHGPPPTGGLLLAELPDEIRRELLADEASDPEPSGATATMSLIEANAVASSPAGYTALDVCRARRTVLTSYAQNWLQMSDGQRRSVTATAASWGESAADRCAAAFEQANGSRIASQKAEERLKTDAMTVALDDVLRPKQIVRVPISSPEKCQWWRDEIQRDDHEAAIATTRDLRDGWDHNMKQAQSAYDDLCR